MPQMAPLSWLTLFIFFISIFLLFSTINYFSFTYPVKKEITKKAKLIYNWKW